MTRKCHVRFGGGPSEKCSTGQLVGGLPYYHEGGKQKKLYLGRTDDPEAVLAEKRAQRPAN